jgi:hypothetical protein
MIEELKHFFKLFFHFPSSAWGLAIFIVAVEAFILFIYHLFVNNKYE